MPFLLPSGCELVLLDLRKHRSSQTDPVSLAVAKKPLARRTHTLPDGRVIGRDVAAALLMLRIGLTQKGREPPWAARPETYDRAA